MADRIIPDNRDDREFNHSSAEKRLYKALKADMADKNFIIIHSLKLKQSEADFIILHKELGVLLIEMKGGYWEFRDGKIKNNSGDTKDPEKQLKQCRKCLFKLFENLKLPKNEYPWISCLVWLPDVAELKGFRETAFLNKDNLCFEDLEYPPFSREPAVKDTLYKKWASLSRNRTRLSDDSLQRITNALCPDFRVAESADWVWRRTRALQNRLAERQEVLLSLLTNQKRAVIRGGAGTGKSWLAEKKAERLAEEGGDGVCFTCFNDILREDTAKRLSHKDNISVLHLFEHYGIDPRDGSIRDKQQEIAKRIREQGFPWRHVIIDEAQDLEREVLEALFQGCADKDGVFWAFYDPNQLVHFDHSGKSWLEEDHPGTAKLLLTCNLRNTAQIARAAEGYAALSEDYARETLPGMQPRVWLPREGERPLDAAARILQSYRDGGIRLYNTAILTMKGWDNAMKELSGDPENLRELAIGSETLKRDASLDIFAGNRLCFTTVRKFKGMEADSVIIIDADEKLLEGREREKQLFYTACTRACLYLDVLLTPGAARVFRDRAGGRAFTPELAEELLNMKADICE